MTRWFRHYEGLVNDPKLGSVAHRAATSLPNVVYVWCAILESATKLDQGGVFKLDTHAVVFSSGIDLMTLDTILMAMETVELIEDQGHQTIVVHWKERQFDTDTSRDRTRAYRARREALGLPRGADLKRFVPALKNRDGHNCVYCDGHTNLCVDHMVPVIKGGTDDLDNLAIACRACNSGKAGRTPQEAGISIKSASARAAYERFIKSHARPEMVTVTPVTVTVTPPENREERETRTSTVEGSLRSPSTSEAPGGALLTVVRNGDAEANSPADAQFYRRCKEVLGEKKGGMIGTKLLRAKKGVHALARAAIEQASTKADPEEYVWAVIRGRSEEEKADRNWIDPRLGA